MTRERKLTTLSAGDTQTAGAEASGPGTPPLRPADGGMGGGRGVRSRPRRSSKSGAALKRIGLPKRIKR